MRVVDRLADREAGWRELHTLLLRLEATPPRRVLPEDVLRVGELYRSACADLMLAEAYDLPRDTVAYLHALVGRAHNVVYQTQGYRWRDWAGLLFDEVPRRLRADPLLRAAAAVFWGLFLLCAVAGAADRGFVDRVLGPEAIEQVEAMYERPVDGSGPGSGGRLVGRNDAAMAGFYILHNAGIGLSCYAWGLLFGLGSLGILASNAISLGTMFGHMATLPQASNFFTFVTAHGPFELSAVICSAAAGLRLGSGLIVTRGQSRRASLRREAHASLPIAGLATILFVLAAFLEGFVSASPLPYVVKALIAVASASLLAAYLLALGRGGAPDAAEVAGGA